MRPPTPLPPQLTGRVFTRSEALAFGVTDHRLTAWDIERVARATYRHLPHRADTGTSLRSADPQQTRTLVDEPRELDLELLRALCKRSPSVWASHLTAARLHGMSLSSALSRNDALHLTGVSRSHYSRMDPTVVLHRAPGVPASLRRLYGIPMSAPEGLFVELARYASVSELIVIGDQLVRRPHGNLEPRSEALSTVTQLKQAVEEGRGRLGIAKAREAIEWVRVGSDSPPETLLRLALSRAHLPEPELQMSLDPHDPYAPVGDTGYRDQRIVIQYDGHHHFSAEQQARDQRRNAQFEAAGWTVVLVNAVDLREGFRSAVDRVRVLLHRAAPQQHVSELRELTPRVPEFRQF